MVELTARDSVVVTVPRVRPRVSVKVLVVVVVTPRIVITVTDLPGEYIRRLLD